MVNVHYFKNKEVMRLASFKNNPITLTDFDKSTLSTNGTV